VSRKPFIRISKHIAANGKKEWNRIIGLTKYPQRMLDVRKERDASRKHGKKSFIEVVSCERIGREKLTLERSQRDISKE
jgi:regulator of PEP synthase PpsR (kinase-PPPase family)